MKSVLKKFNWLPTAKSAMILVMTLLLPILSFAQTSDVVEAPTEFNPSKWDWEFWMYAIAAVLLIVVIARIFDITKLAEGVTGKTVVNWNKVNGALSLIILVAGAIGVWYEMKYHGKYVMNSNAASEHGKSWDSMFNWTFGFTFVVFIITQILLFWFPFRYQYKENAKALYYFHNNKLELIWSSVPAIVLTALVLNGYNTWSKITNPDTSNATEIEVVAQQFQWRARYGGADGKLGTAHFTLINSKNELGVAIEHYTDSLIIELEKSIADVNNQLTEFKSVDNRPSKKVAAFQAKYDSLVRIRPERGYEKEYKEIKTALCDAKSGAAVDKLEAELRRLTTQLDRVKKIRQDKKFFNGTGNDDVITTEICLIKNKVYKFKFRSKDVLHSAWMPEFRAQMNCVPGMPTQFVFTPIKTTAEARAEKGNPKYNYYLYCNKICGASHSNMKIAVTVVGTEAEYKEWMSKQKPLNYVAPVEMEAPKTGSSDTTKKLAVK